MKREIKFRAWDETLKIMITPFIDFHYFEESPNCKKMNVLHQNFDEYENFVPTEIMQFTGLKDKDGKEIYEDDIVTIDNEENPVKTICKYEPGIFILEDNAGGHWTRQLFHQPDRLLVIGNIYENKSLLDE